MKFNIWDVIDKIEDWWPWNGQGDNGGNVNPHLNPVLLIPGIGGSILNAVSESGSTERVWVRLLSADKEFRTKLWSIFHKDTGKTVSLDPSVEIQVPQDRYGLYGCDILDPGLILRLDVVYYYHDLIKQMLSWGYQEGTTLFGFPYDFRQSNRLQERMDDLKEKLKCMYETSGGKKINIVAHSMGGLVVKCFLGLYPEEFEKYVNNWVSVTVPFQGAPGFITDCLLTGVEFVKGWQRELFIAKWSMHQLLIECPAIYELMAAQTFTWCKSPELRLWRQKRDANGLSQTDREAFGPESSINVMIAALKNNTSLSSGVTQFRSTWVRPHLDAHNVQLNVNGKTIPAPLNPDILQWAMETRRILDSARLPKSVSFYNIYGIGLETPLHTCYGTEESPIQELEQILDTEAVFTCVDGDGTVPSESAMADNLNAKARIGIPGDHRGILNDERLFRVLQYYLKAGEPDPFYDPHNDFVILPTRKEFEKHKRAQLAKNKTEIVKIPLSQSVLEIGCPLESEEDYVYFLDKDYIAAISTGTDKDDTRAEAHAHITKIAESGKPGSSEEENSVEIDTVGVAEGANQEETAAALDKAIAAASEEAVLATAHHTNSGRSTPE